MIHGEVVGEIWSTMKVGSLVGRKLLIVRPHPGGSDVGPRTDVVAVDLVSAGVGDRVLVAFGKAARHAAGDERLAFEAAVVGVVDGFRIRDEEVWPPPEAPAAPKAKKKKSNAKTKAKSSQGRAAKQGGRKAREVISELPGIDDVEQLWEDAEVPDDGKGA